MSNSLSLAKHKWHSPQLQVSYPSPGFGFPHIYHSHSIGLHQLVESPWSSTPSVVTPPSDFGALRNVATSPLAWRSTFLFGLFENCHFAKSKDNPHRNVNFQFKCATCFCTCTNQGLSGILFYGTRGISSHNSRKSKPKRLIGVF